MGPYGYKWTQAGDEVPHPNLTLTVRRYTAGGVTFMGVLLFSVYGMCIYVYVYVYNYVHIACSSVRCWLVTITIHVV